MQRIWKESVERWSLFRLKHFSSRNSFVPIPQDYEHDHPKQQENKKTTNNGDPQSSSQELSIIKNILNKKSKVLQRVSIDNKAIYSTKNLLNTKQLIALTYFALTAVNILQI